jgi:glycosyltransferase involved in cell wall biosynthesis
MKQELVRFGVPADKVAVISNSTPLPPEASYIPDTKKAYRERLGLGPEKTAVFVGRVAKEKNLDILINAWAAVHQEFDNAQLLILGEGGAYRNVEEELQALTVRLGLSHGVHFLGHVEDPTSYLLAADVFILPSTAEGMSNALVEAFACGAAIVATDIPANTTLCSHNEDSLLVPVGDVNALSGAVRKLFGSCSLAKKLGEAARRKAEEQLTVDSMVEAYLRAYGDMLAEGR